MISVIMACYLGDYPGAATDRERKLKRAIDSFLMQNIGELIIVADGCTKTVEIVKEYNNDAIKLIWMEKQVLFSGALRNEGIKHASYDWICYLDSDDEFLEGHLDALIRNIDNNYEWMYYDDLVNGVRRNNTVSICRIGTTSIAHKKTVNAVWPDGYNHDWYFITQLGNNYKKIDGARYNLHHIPGKIDT